MVINALSINSFASTKPEDLKMHLAVSVFHLSGGKDEREGPAAVKRILVEHRGGKGKLLEHTLNLCMPAQLYMCPCLNVKGRGAKGGLVVCRASILGLLLKSRIHMGNHSVNSEK